MAAAGFETDTTACALVEVRALCLAPDAVDALPADDDAVPDGEDPVSAYATP